MEKTIEKTFTLEESFALWKQTSKEGKSYFSGTSADGKVAAFYNTNKKNPKEPDLRVIDKDNNDYASLWCNVSKNDVKYLTGSLKTGKKLVGFFAKEEIEKRPYIRVYFKEDAPKVEEKEVVTADASNLPF